MSEQQKNNFNLKLNLAVLDHKIQEIEGTKCIVIPIQENDLYLSEKGNVYLSLNGWESANLMYEKTHLIKQSLSKEVWTAMSEDERSNIPILGDMQPSKF